MKMKLTFLLLASVFFVSCGMPTIFAPIDSEYYLAQVNTPSLPDTVEGKLEMKLQPGPNYDLLLDPKAEGPSLMFFYTFDSGSDSRYQLISNDLHNFSYKFKQEFAKNSFDTKPVSNPAELLSIDKNDEKVFLYGVNNSSGSNFTAKDQYVLFAQDQGNKAALNPFSLKKIDLPSKDYVLYLDWTDTSPSPPNFISNVQASGNRLYDFAGQPFTLEQSEVNAKINSDTNHEYNFVENNPTKVQLHLFAAFFISGPFSNYFWSELVYLGAIPITLE